MAEKESKFTEIELVTVKDLIVEAQKDLIVGEYQITFCCTDESPDSGGYVLNAEIDVLPRYLIAHIQFHKPSVDNFRNDREAFISTVYHEIAHCLIDPLYKDQVDEVSRVERYYFNELREQAVTKVSRIGLKLRALREEQ